jgi:hypothetical protein
MGELFEKSSVFLIIKSSEFGGAEEEDCWGGGE